MNRHDEWIQRARQFITDALFLFEAGRYESALITSYFACFSACMALADHYDVVLLKKSKLHPAD